jgi:hypothetical protein
MFSTDFTRSLRPASMARCTGSSGGFASYRREPLVGTYRGAGLVIMSARAFAVGAASGYKRRTGIVTTFSTASRAGSVFRRAERGQLSTGVDKILAAGARTVHDRRKVDPRPRVLNVVAPSIRLVADTFPA